MYFVFVYSQYYPAGGMCDYKDAFPTLEAAKKLVDQTTCDYADIAVVKNGKLVKVASWDGKWEDDNGQ